MAPGIFCAAAEDGFSKARSFCGATQLITCMPYYSVKLSSFTLDPRKSPDARELLLAWTDPTQTFACSQCTADHLNHLPQQPAKSCRAAAPSLSMPLRITSKGECHSD